MRIQWNFGRCGGGALVAIVMSCGGAAYADDLKIYLCSDAVGHKELSEVDKGGCKPLDVPDPAKVARKPAVGNSGVRLGMTMDEVRKSSWGKPRHVNRTTTYSGVTEQWVYDGGMLYFTDGRLTTIQD